MIFTKTKSYEEIINQLGKQDVITIISCSSCARVSGTGGEESMKQLALQLRKDGYQVHSGYSINAVCTPKVFQAALAKPVNTLISMSCSAGTSNIAQAFTDLKVVAVTDDVGLMILNNKEKLIEVAMPYESNSVPENSVFEAFTGKPLVKHEENLEVSK